MTRQEKHRSQHQAVVKHKHDSSLASWQSHWPVLDIPDALPHGAKRGS
jgi:hypothetical protein